QTSLHALYRFAAERQTDTRAFVTIVGGQALEDTEDLIVIRLIETDAVVAHPQHDTFANDLGADLDSRHGYIARELDGVVQQVAQHDQQRLAVDVHLDIGHVDLNVDRVGTSDLHHLVDELIDEAAQSNLLTLELAALDPRIGKQTVDELCHSQCAAAHSLHVLELHGAQFVLSAFHEQVTESI